MFYFEVLESFYRNKIRYLVVGGLAVNLHGVPRTTLDIDIIPSLEKSNITLLCSTLKNLDYVPRLPVSPEGISDPVTLKAWKEEKNLKAFSFYHKEQNHKVIDLVLVHPLNFDEAESHCKIIHARGVDIPIVSIDDLIEMKAFSGRSRDLSDIEMLKEAKEILENGNE